jgi:protein gp37
MGELTKIGWCDHTFNPWWGCVRVSPGCERCYAETFSKRVGLQVWGAEAERRFFGDKHWNEPRKWNAAAAKAGKRARVFCASMADVFEYARSPVGLRMIQERVRLFELIEATPWLDWLLLTKRPENVNAMVPERWLREGFPPNVWIGTTAEDQKRYDARVLELARIPARVRFLSVEPMLEPIELHLVGTLPKEVAGGAYRPVSSAIDWIICGGESGPKARPFRDEWARALLAECREHDVPFFMKQMGSKPEGRVCDAEASNYGAFVPYRLKHPKGEDMAEWPSDLRVQEWPS